MKTLTWGTLLLKAFTVGMTAAIAACGSNESINIQKTKELNFKAFDDRQDDTIYIRLPAQLLTTDFVRSTQFNRDHIRDDLFAFGYLPRKSLDALPASIVSEIVELDAQLLAQQRFDPQTLAHLAEAASSNFTPNASYEDYHDYDALTDELQDLAAAHPDLTTLTSVGRSVQGRELWMLKISDDADLDENEPKLLYVANMHGDEVVGRELMIYLARRLLSDYESDRRIANLVNHAQIYLIPSMNPDGFEARRRFNARGIDLNRDFPDFTSDPYDSPNGRAPETAALMALHDQHQFVLALNFHGGEVCFNLPWDTKSNAREGEKFGDDELLTTLGRRYAEANPTMRRNSGGSFDRGLTYGYEWYEVDGGMQDWASYYRNSTHATVELSQSKWPPASALPALWSENEEALITFLEDGIFGVHLLIQDQEGQAVHGASIGLSSSRRTVAYPLGDNIHRLSQAGEQAVKVTAPGFKTHEFVVNAKHFDGQSMPVTLER